jgi:hypothetical protein
MHFVYQVRSCLLTIMVAENMRSDMFSYITCYGTLWFHVMDSVCHVMNQSAPKHVRWTWFLRASCSESMFHQVNKDWYLLTPNHVHKYRLELYTDWQRAPCSETSLWVITLGEYEGVILSTCW